MTQLVESRKQKSGLPSPCHKSMKTISQIHEIEMLSHSPYSPKLAPCNCTMFADLKKCFQKRYSDWIKRWSFFAPKDYTFFKRDIDRIIVQKFVFSLVILRTFKPIKYTCQTNIGKLHNKDWRGQRNYRHSWKYEPSEKQSKY